MRKESSRKSLYSFYLTIQFLCSFLPLLLWRTYATIEAMPRRRPESSPQENSWIQQSAGWLQGKNSWQKTFRWYSLYKLLTRKFFFQTFASLVFYYNLLCTVVMTTSSGERLVQIPTLPFISVWPWTCFFINKFCVLISSSVKWGW